MKSEISKLTSLTPVINSRRFWGVVAIVLILSLWLGIPTYRKWKADKLVDELCAKDGGIKVYETVMLSTESFDNFGEVFVPAKRNIKQSSEYYYSTETNWIIPESNTIGGMDLYTSHYTLFRVKDGKLLAEGVGYARRGGDPIGPWHPSSYGCSSQYDIKYINKKTFINKHTGGAK